MKIGYLIRQLVLGATARSSSDYWERRYKAGLTSGLGSYGDLARFKAEILNAFVKRHDISSVIEFGCGDGNQLTLAEYPRYLGLDVSKTAIDTCVGRFQSDPSKAFVWYDPARAVNLANFVTADLTLSLDVMYHLLEDTVYWNHLRHLFSTSRRFVIVYSSDRDQAMTAAHVRHRRFTVDVQREFADFQLIQRIGNRAPDHSDADFFIYERVRA